MLSCISIKELQYPSFKHLTTPLTYWWLNNSLSPIRIPHGIITRREHVKKLS